MTCRRDPEPITILIAIAGVTGASFSALNYWRSHHRPLPHKVRRKLVRQLDVLSRDIRYLRADVEALEQLFQVAKFPHDRTLRLGNGAMLTFEQYRHYEKITDAVLSRLKKIHRTSLRVQGFAFEMPYVDKGHQANTTGEALERIEALIQSRDYSVDGAWRDLRAIVEDLESMINQLNTELRRNGGSA